MGSSNNMHLSNDASEKEIREWLDNHTVEEVELIKQDTKKQISACERGKVRRNIEEIRERNHLKELLGEDDLLDS